MCRFVGHSTCVDIIISISINKFVEQKSKRINEFNFMLNVTYAVGIIIIRLKPINPTKS